MCGIIGYIGKKEANRILISGLERLEYRGYDSAGVAIIDDNNNNENNDNKINTNKVKGRVENLKCKNIPGMIGIAHTRWATHGRPSDANAHPFVDKTQDFAIVHNGIIENYLELKEELRKEGVSFTSDTDSEVIVHLIARNYSNNIKEAVIKTVKKLQGAYAFCVIKNDKKEIIGARNGSPLIVGVGEEENFLASDVSAVVEYTKKVIYLGDFQIAEVKNDSLNIYDFNGDEKEIEIKTIDWNLELAQKDGYKHFMLKEIFEQPKVIEDTLKVKMDIKKDFSKIIMVACGTASYAGLVGKYLIEKIAKIPVTYEIASEFRYREPLIDENDLVIAISQSGETADTLAAIRLAKEKGAKTLGLINVVDSTIAREVDDVLYTRAGPEIGVASTKAFISQLILIYKLAFKLAGKEFYFDLNKFKETLSLNEKLKELAKKYFLYQNFLYIGRNTSFPLALEGALKLKEISYIHAEAYPAGELKHGPIALVSEDMPTLAICPMDEVYLKTFSNIEEIKARDGKVISIATEGDQKIKEISDDIIYVPKVEEIFYPLLITIPLQLFAYHIADLKECDIDKPRNLAKSVTVE
ncbi:MAG: glutamine--fructose-6-phosphate transaminase (isomerizing) [Nanoarchaeota archaeon]|nr:glutamine--fructose-6-phosphate transaminase (isomerizing) [Nanoarchaeota archaeon]MBU1631677.1 glutamine--fructose-6-phosphate transaminase (isomerizing) [Nanoarchaeota archaeon]MBU1875560.1 glutamine--fructose-6-phosphate transaminase (isomerizing) [Nanoarchaeota archaeon]